MNSSHSNPTSPSQSIVFYHRLPFRIGIFAGLTTGLLVVLTLFWVSSFASKTLEEESTRKTQAIGQLLSSNVQAFFDLELRQSIEKEDTSPKFEETQKLISNLAPKLEGLLFIEVRNKEKTSILIWKENDGVRNLLTDPIAKEKVSQKIKGSCQTTSMVDDKEKKIGEISACFSTNNAVLAQIELQKITSILAVASIFIGLIVVFLFAQARMAILKKTAVALEKIGTGDLTQQLPSAKKDEIGRVNTMLNSTIKRIGNTLQGVYKHSFSLSSASTQMSVVSNQLETSASETLEQSLRVTKEAEHVCDLVQMVSTGTEQLSQSIKEISQSATQADQEAKKGVEIANRTNEIIQALDQSSKEIEKIIKLIITIADQTNLLALNASIEAARSGEAGKGFAVVAQEVKSLSNKTALATDDIGSKINQIQQDIQEAVSTIKNIVIVINNIHERQNNITTAVAEQSLTTNEIGRIVSQAAHSSQEIMQTISETTKIAEQTKSGAENTQKSAEEMDRMARALKEMLSQFKTS